MQFVTIRNPRKSKRRRPKVKLPNILSASVATIFILAAQIGFAIDYPSDLGDLVDYYDNDPDSNGYVIMYDQKENGDFQYVFTEVDNAGIIDVANNFDSAGKNEGIDPTSFDQPLADYIGSRGLSVNTPGSGCMFEVYCPDPGTGGF